jgi:hypothetical protein
VILDDVHDLTSTREPQPPTQPALLRGRLLRAAVIVIALGVLPHVWDAAPATKLFGTLASVAVVARSLQLVWRAGFSTHPRHVVER